MIYFVHFRWVLGRSWRILASDYCSDQILRFVTIPMTVAWDLIIRRAQEDRWLQRLSIIRSWPTLIGRMARVCSRTGKLATVWLLFSVLCWSFKVCQILWQWVWKEGEAHGNRMRDFRPIINYNGFLLDINLEILVHKFEEIRIQYLVNQWNDFIFEYILNNCWLLLCRL